MAIACLRLVTLPALPPLPERSFPAFSRRRARSTLLLAALPYFLGIEFLRFVKARSSAWCFDATLPPTLKKRGWPACTLTAASRGNAEPPLHTIILVNGKGIARGESLWTFEGVAEPRQARYSLTGFLCWP